jgi:RNA polymerase sigma-70 factor (ECF subfamily)
MDPSFEDEVRRLLSDYRLPLLRYALRRVERDAADDVVAETLAVAWRHIQGRPQCQDEEILWLFGIERRVVANTRRSDRRQRRLVGRLASARRSDSQSAPAADGLLAALAGLSPDAREAVMLTYWEGLSHREIAVVLDCSENAVAKRLSRARKQLLLRLRPDSPQGLSEGTDVKETIR